MKKKQFTILIVEDDESTQKLLETHLHYEGYPTLTAGDGRTALELARARRPALVVLDLMLPEVHGIAVCQAIKSNPETQKTKVLVVSVKSFPADRKQATEAGADAFLAKPLDRVEFLSTVENLLKA